MHVECGHITIPAEWDLKISLLGDLKLSFPPGKENFFFFFFLKKKKKKISTLGEIVLFCMWQNIVPGTVAVVL